MTEASVAAYEEGQERLSSAVLAACEPAGTFPAKVGAALGAAFSLLDSDPPLALLLALWPDRGDPALRRLQWDWRTRQGELLRRAAKQGGAALPPFFLEPTLIAGVGFSVSCHVLKGQAPRLVDRLLPTARWYLLSYYLAPDELVPYGTGACDDVDRPSR